MTSRLLIAFAAIAAFALTGCTDKKTGSGVNGDKTVEQDPGKALFAPAEYRTAAIGDFGVEPVTVPLANVVILHKLDMPSDVDGIVRWVGVETDEAAAAKLNASDVFRHKRDKKVYRRLIPGDFIERDQVVALLDDDMAFYEYQAAVTKAEAAKKSAVSYEETVNQLKAIVDKTAEGVRKGIVPEQELLNSKATLARYQAELTDHQGSAAVALAEAERVRIQYEKHRIRTVVGGEVQQVLKREGDGVKRAEPVMVIHEFSKLRAVGNLPKEYINTVFRGDDVVIQVPRDVPPGTTFAQHTTNKSIAAIAVGMVNGKPAIVSAGEDGWIYAWSDDLKVLGADHLPGGVRSLAVTRPGVEPAYAVAGGADGTVRLYTISNVAKERRRDLEGKHDGGVTAVAFSPDGKYLVTADERGIYMYSVADGKRMYAFPSKEHHSPITSLTFTPQGRVVSVGREPSIRVWEVGASGARVKHRIDSRSGDVPMPGVTDDGSRLLLDADKTHLDVIHLQDLRKERPLVTAGEAARFTTFTAWSPELNKDPDNRLIATTGGAEGTVQLWRAPTAKGRGAEVARMVTRGSAAATCAAFSPNGENGFIVVGTRKGDVHLWPLPASDVQAEVKAEVTHVDKTIESSGRTVSVLVDFENPKTGPNRYLLRPGAAVTLVISPKK